MNWWYELAGERVGPFSVEEMRDEVEAGRARGASKVWKAGMMAWLPLRDVEPLRQYLDPSELAPPPVTRRLPSAALLPMSGPWRRFMARMFDVWWETALIAFFIGAVFGGQSVWFLEWIWKPGGSHLLGLACLPLAMVLDAGIHTICGNTPGKALLGLRVGDARAESPGFMPCLRRNMAVWVKGLALGLPIVNLFTLGYQHGRVKKERVASYDVRTGLRVRAGALPLWRRGVFATLFLALFVVVLGLQETDRQFDRKILHARQSPTFSWQNAITNISVDVSSSWTYHPKTGDKGDGYATFTEPSGHAAVIFAEEVLRGADLHPYVRAFRAGNAGKMDFDDDGAYRQIGKLPAWALTGVLTKENSRVQVEIVKQGDRFWRTVVVQTEPYAYSDEMVGKLRDALRNSIGGTNGPAL